MCCANISICHPTLSFGGFDVFFWNVIKRLITAEVSGCVLIQDLHPLKYAFEGRFLCVRRVKHCPNSQEVAMRTTFGRFEVCIACKLPALQHYRNILLLPLPFFEDRTFLDKTKPHGN